MNPVEKVPDWPNRSPRVQTTSVRRAQGGKQDLLVMQARLVRAFVIEQGS